MWEARWHEEQAIVGSSEEQGNAQDQVGDAVAVALGKALNEAVHARPVQLIGNGALGGR
jgi:hypothetical protein